ncbi:uncharacterized protein K452DRAFT_362972 [Aplosporella prunicola CBS 121167]|uniref:Kelch repeat protein n=1 Tax=Aplosporella prunicola CBS 121167 TaxID=1176127 RepID=A0A6A6AWV2_9PEZI|nr:uncharacterized protein K452DRAFT_362972 [Aplosporella prunicola CBS 121167]KAF2135748.1 hypothetical protein K452DRAFT_362972 [Aplosporella prunicola CBS 121167]
MALYHRAPDNPSATKFLRRAGHGSALIGDFVYIDGGKIAQNYTDSTGEEQFDWSRNNVTLSIDLRSSWNTSSVSIRAIEKNSDGPYFYLPEIWADPSSDSLYLWAGQVYDSEPPSSAFWKFDTTGTGGGSWSNATEYAVDLDDLSRPIGGLSASTSDVGFLLGGVITAKKDPIYNGTASDFIGITGMISYNWTSGKWSNDTAPVFPPSNTAIFGRMQHVPTFGSNGLLFALGGESPPMASPHNTTRLNSFSHITFYDPVSKDWYWQEATGPAPSMRERFCLAGAQSHNDTFEIFVFGGWDPVDPSDMSEIYILSLPAFRWFQTGIRAISQRVLHTCHVIGSRQLLSIGGLESAYDDLGDRTINQWKSKDNFTQGLGIFDMTELKWSDKYVANASAYDSPEMVKLWYSDGQREPTWTLPEVRKLFIEHTSNVNDSNENATSTKIGSHSKGHGGTKASTVAGSVVAAVVAIICLVSLAVWLMKRRRRSKGQQNPVFEVEDTSPEQKPLSELHNGNIVELPHRPDEPPLHGTSELDSGLVAELPHRPDEPPLQGRHELDG